MPSEKRKIGDIGEAVAVRFLEENGFRILTQNYLKKWGEIDIVATSRGNLEPKNKTILHFIEVKTVQKTLGGEVSREPIQRSGSRETIYYNPAENVHPKKLERLCRTVETYLTEKRISHETDWQIDVVIVLLDLNSKKAKVDLLDNIV